MENNNSLEIFNFEEKKEVRTKILNNEICFNLPDICNILGLSNSRKVASQVDKDDVISSYIGVKTGVKKDGRDAIQNIRMNFVNESGLYQVIFMSRKPQAKKFKRWVTSEVLPTIRKTGSYGIDERRSDGWGSTRIDGKRERKDLTDVIKDFVEYAKSQGSNGSKWYYKHITSACNDALFGVDSLRKINKNLRDEVDTGQLSTIRTLEQAIKKRLMDLLEEEPRRSYKDIFNELKKVCMTFEELLGISKPRYISNGDYIKCMSKKRLKQLKNNDSYLLFEK